MTAISRKIFFFTNGRNMIDSILERYGETESLTTRKEISELFCFFNLILRPRNLDDIYQGRKYINTFTMWYRLSDTICG